MENDPAEQYDQSSIDQSPTVDLELPLVDRETTIKLVMRGIGNAWRPRRMVRDMRAINAGELPWDAQAS